MTEITIPLEKLMETIRQRLQSRGAEGIRGLGRAFRKMDDDGNKTLNKAEFSKALSTIGLKVNKTELESLLHYFDRNHDGNVSFDEFLYGIRGNLNDSRKRLVHKAFQLLDIDGNGEISLAEMLKKYNAKGHPKVLSGEMTEEQAIRELMRVFEGDEGNGDGKISLREFENYYCALSSSIDRDDYFSLMMCQAWKMSPE